MDLLEELPVAVSRADTTSPFLVSRSNVTSIFGTPRGAGEILESWNEPRNWHPCTCESSLNEYSELIVAMRCKGVGLLYRYGHISFEYRGNVGR
jgi:hypothetical protein